MFYKILPKLYGYLLSLLLTALIFILHTTQNVDCMLNNFDNKIDTEYLKLAIEYHKSGHPSFAKRPLTTLLIEKTAFAFGLNAGICFVIINFLLLFISGILIFELSKINTNNIYNCYLNQFFYFAWFSNLFAFFVPVYTYDEPLQFCFILTSFLFLKNKKWLLFMLFFSLAIISRESTVILIPGLYIIHSTTLKIGSKLLNETAIFVIPIIVYVIFLWLYLTNQNLVEPTLTDFPKRFGLLQFNFQNKNASIISITAIVLMSIFPIYFFIIKNTFNKIYTKYVWGFWVVFFINTILVYATMQAREARLFVLPMLLIWGVFSSLFKEQLIVFLEIKRYNCVLKNAKIIALLIFYNLLNYYYCFKIFAPCFNSNENYFPEYLFLLLGIISIHFSLYITEKKSMWIVKTHPILK